jgi:hypothetical protein
MLCAQQTTRPAIAIMATPKGEVPVSRSALIDSAMCDDAGNLYIRPFRLGNASDYHHAPIQEITSEAQPAGTFPAGAHAFFVHEGRAYFSAGSGRGVIVDEFAQDGSRKAEVKLSVDFFVDVMHLAVFRSGEFLVVGLSGSLTGSAPHLRTPFTAVFAADGRLVKKIYEPEDEDARQRAEGSDPKYFPCCADSGNKFVMNADVAAGSDGNVYLLHGTYPPLIYVISPTGDVVRKLRIDAGNPELTANSIKFYKDRLAIGLGWLGDVPSSLIKVIDLKGNPIADYEVKEGAKDSNPILACYNSDGFTLIPRWVGTKPYLLTARVP